MAYSYNYGIDGQRGQYFEVFYGDQQIVGISEKDWEVDSVRVTTLEPIEPFPDPAKAVVENWFKFTGAPAKKANLFRKALGYTKKSFDAARAGFGGPGNDEHATPPEVLEFVRLFGKIALDPFSMAGSFVGATNDYYYPTNDGFKDPWVEHLSLKNGNVVWTNPPFSQLNAFADKWVEEYGKLSRGEYDEAVLDPVLIGIVPDTKHEQLWRHKIARSVQYEWHPIGRTNYYKDLGRGLELQSSAGFPSVVLIADPFGHVKDTVLDWSIDQRRKWLEEAGSLVKTKVI